MASIDNFTRDQKTTPLDGSERMLGEVFQPRVEQKTSQPSHVDPLFEKKNWHFSDCKDAEKIQNEIFSRPWGSIYPQDRAKMEKEFAERVTKEGLDLEGCKIKTLFQDRSGEIVMPKR